MDYFFDLNQKSSSQKETLLWENWEENEHVVIFSPHDDDAVLGCGYLIRHFTKKNIPVSIVIFCEGDAGYSTAEERDTIVLRRKKETIACYEKLGVHKENIHYMGVPDFSLFSYSTRFALDGKKGTFDPLVTLLRKIRATRIFVPNGYLEHQDHEAVYNCGIYDAVQSSDPILADLGEPICLKSVTVYAVWADFSPIDAMVSKRETQIRANCGILSDESAEEAVIDAIRSSQSQLAIIDNLIAQRQSRKMGRGWAELYQKMQYRPSLDYSRYQALIDQILS